MRTYLRIRPCAPKRRRAATQRGEEHARGRAAIGKEVRGQAKQARGKCSPGVGHSKSQERGQNARGRAHGAHPRPLCARHRVRWAVHPVGSRASVGTSSAFWQRGRWGRRLFITYVHQLEALLQAHPTPPHWTMEAPHPLRPWASRHAWLIDPGCSPS